MTMNSYSNRILRNHEKKSRILWNDGIILILRTMHYTRTIGTVKAHTRKGRLRHNE